MDPTVFSPEYATARARFLQAAGAAGAAATEAHEHPERGPDDGPLYTDVAWFGPADAERVLVLASGTHGVEGHCGSGAQVDWLRRGETARLPEGVAALLIHALNPYGFAWSRRVTHENVDLNRNFVDFDAGALPENPGYEEIAPHILPETWTPESQATTRAEIVAYAGRHGPAALAQAISGGQYRHPRGLFYGGREPTWSRRTLEAILQRRLASARQVGVIDYHTGLGPPGYGELIISGAEGTDRCRRARGWYGAAGIPTGAADSASAPLSGDWLDALPALLPHAEVTAIALEFGTVPSAVVAEALRADNWLHARGDPGSEQGLAIRAQTRAAFYTDDDLWRGMVLGQSLAATRAAVAGLSAKA